MTSNERNRKNRLEGGFSMNKRVLMEVCVERRRQCWTFSHSFMFFFFAEWKTTRQKTATCGEKQKIWRRLTGEVYNVLFYVLVGPWIGGNGLSHVQASLGFEPEKICFLWSGTGRSGRHLEAFPQSKGPQSVSNKEYCTTLVTPQLWLQQCGVVA